jgi:hypothetical protein
MAKNAHIFVVPSESAHTFGWKWRSSDGQEEAAGTFEYFYDCVEDARSHGLVVNLAGTLARTVDGSIRDASQMSGDLNSLAHVTTTQGNASDSTK